MKTIIFEGELEDRSYQKDFEYFKDFDLKFYDMMRKLLKTDNISFSHIQIEEGLTEADFEKLEKKFKRPIPKAVKEFYSIFGELRILWKHRNPYIDTGVSASKTVWNMDFRDNHFGSLQILPLSRVLFEAWDDEKYCLGVGTDLKIFDTSSDYHMVALDVTHEGNPFVYRGEDHGVQFNEATPLLFTEYMDLCIGLFGIKERMRYFQTPGFNNDKSENELEDAIAGKIEIDLNNDVYVNEKVQEITTLIDQAISKKDFKEAQNHVMELHNLKKTLFARYMLDLDRLQQLDSDFSKRMSYAVKEQEIDWAEYEETHKGDPIFESKDYLKVKKKF